VQGSRMWAGRARGVDGLAAVVAEVTPLGQHLHTMCALLRVETGGPVPGCLCGNGGSQYYFRLCLLFLCIYKPIPAPPGRPGTPSRCPRRAAAAPPQALLLRHSKIAAVVRWAWSPQPRITLSHKNSRYNSRYLALHLATKLGFEFQ